MFDYTEDLVEKLIELEFINEDEKEKVLDEILAAVSKIEDKEAELEEAQREIYGLEVDVENLQGEVQEYAGSQNKALGTLALYELQFLLEDRSTVALDIEFTELIRAFKAKHNIK